MISPLHSLHGASLPPGSPLQRAGTRPTLSLPELLNTEGKNPVRNCVYIPNAPMCNLGHSVRAWCGSEGSGFIQLLNSGYSIVVPSIFKAQRDTISTGSPLFPSTSPKSCGNQPSYISSLSFYSKCRLVGSGCDQWVVGGLCRPCGWARPSDICINCEYLKITYLIHVFTNS